MTTADSALRFIMDGWPDPHTSMAEIAEELETGSFEHKKLALILRFGKQPTVEEIEAIFGCFEPAA